VAQKSCLVTTFLPPSHPGYLFIRIRRDVQQTTNPSPHLCSYYKNYPTMGTRHPQMGPNPRSSLDDRPYFLDEREIKWANPTMRLPLPQALTHALHYLRVLLSSKDAASWRRLKSIIPIRKEHDLPIAPRWRRILGPDWGNLLDTPCPLVVARVTRQPNIVEASMHIPPPPPHPNGKTAPRLVMHFMPRSKQGASKRGPSNKRKVPQTIAPTRGSDACGGMRKSKRS